MQPGAEFAVDRSQMKKRFTEARAKGRMSDAMLLFPDFSEHIQELENTIHLVIRVQHVKELTKEIRGTRMAFTDANLV